MIVEGAYVGPAMICKSFIIHGMNKMKGRYGVLTKMWTSVPAES
jgi:hypothetical protein